MLDYTQCFHRLIYLQCCEYFWYFSCQTPEAYICCCTDFLSYKSCTLSVISR